jgi:hypothetical protein
MFPNRAVKQLTGKNWHDLSPGSKKMVNFKLKENEKEKKSLDFKDITMSITNTNFFGK